VRAEARRRFVPLGVLLTLCAACSSFTRPDGDGGWSEARREEEVARLQSAAGVTVPEAKLELESKRIEDSLDVASPPPSAPPATPSGEMDLAQALAVAARGNRRIVEAHEQLAATAERVADVRGRLLPATTAEARYTWYTAAQTASVDLPSGVLPPGSAPPVVEIRDADAGTVNARIYVPIDLTGELRHTLSAAQAGYRGERARVWATTLDEQLAVTQAYFQLLEARRLRTVTEETIAVYRSQLGIARSRFDQGRLLKNDLLTVDVALQLAEQGLLGRDLAIEEARWLFNRSIGADVNAPAELADVRRPPDVPSVDRALALAYQENPILLSLLEEQQRLQDTATALERSRLPRFGGGGGMDYSSSDILEPQQIGSGFIGFTWELGTDLRREAQISEARIQSDRNRIATERQLRDLEAAVRAAQLSTAERLAAYRTAQSSLSQAEENLRIREQQFDVGRAQSDDVLIAERLLAEQRATLATALYQAHTRRAALQRLMGLDLEDLNATKAPNARSAASGAGT